MDFSPRFSRTPGPENRYTRRAHDRREDRMTEAAQPDPLRSVHTTTLVQLLTQGGMSFVVSTYQAGKLIVVRATGDVVNTHFRNFNTPMGVAFDRGRLAIGTKVQVWEFHNQPAVAPKLEPAGK